MAVGLIWFVIVYLWFRPKEGLRKHVFTIFLLGMVICFPVGLFNSFWMFTIIPWIFKVSKSGANHLAGNEQTIQIILFFLLVAPIEEIVKFLIVRTESYRLRAFDTVQEGVMLATFSALGFATYENFHYMQNHGFKVIYLRGWLCPAAHMLFSAFFGYYLGLAKTRKYQYGPLIFEGLVLASLSHGFYNGSSSIHVYISGGLVALYLAYYLIMIRTGWHQPVFAWIAPAWMQLYDTYKPGQVIKRPTLTLLTEVSAIQSIETILLEMKAEEKQERLNAIKKSRKIVDQRIYEGLKNLQHDPVAQVREAAQRAIVPLEEKLDEMYKALMNEKFEVG